MASDMAKPKMAYVNNCCLSAGLRAYPIMRLPKTVPIPAPLPAAPMEAAPAPTNFAAVRISCREGTCRDKSNLGDIPFKAHYLGGLVETKTPVWVCAKECNRPYATDVTHYVIALFSSHYIIYFCYMSGKRVVGSTAIIEIRAAWNLRF